jgi:DNA-directed RNA polymerase subunit RPC12/RpoP
MVKIKIACPVCGTALQCDQRQRGEKIKCPHCKELILIPPFPLAGKVTLKLRRSRHKFVLFAGIPILFLVVAIAGMWVFDPVRVHWPDRRPIGELFLASDSSSSAKNPRGWFNDPNLDITGPGGTQRFRKALLDYTDRSITNLKRAGAQGVIVWDLEGEQLPHKITYIGDPRLLDRLAPEMSVVADEFFGRLRSAGFKVGMTIRPQQFTLVGLPRQMQVLNIKRILLQKIDYAKARWGATIFYIDSTGGIRRPDEVAQLRSLAEARPDVLLIPEHHYLPYWEFSAPYNALRKGDGGITEGMAQTIFPGAFEALDISDASDETDKITAAWLQGDILLFRAWEWGAEGQILERLAHQSH